MQIRRTVVVDKPVDRVFDYLADFTNSTEWDPGTVSTTRSAGDGGVGTTYDNTSRFAGRETRLTYTVTDLEPNRRIVLVGKNETVTAEDTMTFTEVGSGTQVAYTADFEFAGPTRYVAPLLAPAFKKLGDEAEAGLKKALDQL